MSVPPAPDVCVPMRHGAGATPAKGGAAALSAAWGCAQMCAAHAIATATRQMFSNFPRYGL